MGYATPVSILAKTYTPTDAVVVANDPDTTTTSTTWVKKKTIMLVGLITPTSLFRYKFDLLFDGMGTAYGRIYRSGIAIGTERTTTSGAYVTFTEDIPATDWKRGDTIELWLRVGAPPGSAKARHFRLCGIGSEFTIV